MHREIPSSISLTAISDNADIDSTRFSGFQAAEGGGSSPPHTAEPICYTDRWVVIDGSGSDFQASFKVQMEDDISTSVVVRVGLPRLLLCI